MDEHLRRDKYQRQNDIEPSERNYRNGYSPKNLRSSFGDVDFDIPRDRKAEFEPQIVKRYETVCNELVKIYPIVYLDAMYFKVRSNGKIVNKAVYICLGDTMEGYKDILGLWVDEVEGAKFWLGICNDLKNRGVKEILIACMDGLKGLPQAI